VSELEAVTGVLPKAFVGQGNARGGKSNMKGQTQKEQVAVLAAFSRGEFNVLVATCIGEEGLDIGEVDLIVAFDAISSPTRMVQRMGRTGRKRAGRAIMLVTEGDNKSLVCVSERVLGNEETKLVKSCASAKSVYKLLQHSSKHFRLYPHSPRLLPAHITPQLQKMAIQVPDGHFSQVMRVLRWLITHYDILRLRLLGIVSLNNT
jgi:Fanconi anemia group M protein